MVYNNYHTHTSFCDGCSSPESIVKAAIKNGCTELGFSGHSYLDFDPSWTMNPETTKMYKKTILDLREKYKEQIKIYLGIEQDICSKTDDLSDYDYVIGAVHCLFKDGHYISVDNSKTVQKECIDLYYGGNSLAFAEDYFAAVSDVYEKTRCNVIAHFDLLTKFDLVDTLASRYIAAEEAALYKLMKTPAVFEINTGAISRGFARFPYPNPRVLEALAAAKKPVIISSDAHSAETLLYGFEGSYALANEYGLEVQNVIFTEE